MISLSIHEHMWPEAGELPTAPALRDLRLFLATSVAGMFRFCSGIFQLLQGEGLPWQLPNLENLTIASPHWYLAAGSNAPTQRMLLVSALDVAVFMLHHLVTAVKPRLLLYGVELYDPTAGLHVQQLETAVPSISLVPILARNVPPLYEGFLRRIDTWMLDEFYWPK